MCSVDDSQLPVVDLEKDIETTSSANSLKNLPINFFSSKKINFIGSL